MRDDPAVAAAVARHQALRQDIFAAFAGTLDEPVPERLQPPAAARVHDLAAVRAARDAAGRQEDERRQKRVAWPQWGALAASLAVGVLAGSLGTGWLGGSSELALARGASGELTAGGTLAQALDRQLAQDAASGEVRVGLSFLSQSGAYCRTFQLGRSGGLACREGGHWRIPVLADSPAPAGEYRQAAAPLPPAVLDAMDARIAGSTLDAAAERAARERGWEAGAVKGG
ncbi:hypothetical protein [Massilia sp. BSC265]|uniref:hypothetical protein n=1 Tax=Massilia sp. BSC265 TaxID=1549812 RepID=UPI00126A69BE|nr:hypothetical protein [Massilia sp. BSC265]